MHQHPPAFVGAFVVCAAVILGQNTLRPRITTLQTKL
jgi:hypothetical protein